MENTKYLNDIVSGLLRGMRSVNSDHTAWRYYDIRIDHWVHLTFYFDERNPFLEAVLSIHTDSKGYVTTFDISLLEFKAHKDTWKLFIIKLRQAINELALEYIKDNKVELNSI